MALQYVQVYTVIEIHRAVPLTAWLIYEYMYVETGHIMTNCKCYIFFNVALKKVHVKPDIYSRNLVYTRNLNISG